MCAAHDAAILHRGAALCSALANSLRKASVTVSTLARRRHPAKCSVPTLLGLVLQELLGYIQPIIGWSSRHATPRPVRAAVTPRSLMRPVR